jgi:hypothetical protein
MNLRPDSLELSNEDQISQEEVQAPTQEQGNDQFFTE